MFYCLFVIPKLIFQSHFKHLQNILYFWVRLVLCICCRYAIFFFEYVTFTILLECDLKIKLQLWTLLAPKKQWLILFSILILVFFYWFNKSDFLNIRSPLHCLGVRVHVLLLLPLSAHCIETRLKPVRKISFTDNNVKRFFSKGILLCRSTYKVHVQSTLSCSYISLGIDYWRWQHICCDTRNTFVHFFSLLFLAMQSTRLGSELEPRIGARWSSLARRIFPTHGWIGVGGRHWVWREWVCK